MSKPCHEAGCDADRAEGLHFCVKHLNVPRRCALKRRSTGEQCKNPARRGLRYCSTHAGRRKRQNAAVDRAKALTAMQRFVKPYEGDLDPISVFEDEFRRTVGRILWYDEQLSRLQSADDLIWGLSKTEQIAASETPGTNETYEARVNMLETLQYRERQHLLALEKVWIGAKLDVEKLNLMKRYVETTYVAVIDTLTRLGIDTAAPEVRDILAESLLSVGGLANPNRAEKEPLALL